MLGNVYSEKYIFLGSSVLYCKDSLSSLLSLLTHHVLFLIRLTSVIHGSFFFALILNLGDAFQSSFPDESIVSYV